MRERRQGVDVCEEVVDKELQHWHWRNGFGVKDSIGRNCQQRLGGGLGRWREAAGYWHVYSRALRGFGSLSVLVWRTTTLCLSVVGAVDAEFATRSTGDVCVVALDLAHTAHVTGASQSRQLGIDGRVSHALAVGRATARRHEMRHIWRVAEMMVLMVLLLLLLLLLLMGYGGLVSFGGSILKGLGIVNCLGGVAGSLQDFQAIAGVDVGGGLGRCRRWWRCRHDGDGSALGKDGFAMADYRGIPGCLVLGFEAR